MPNQAAGLRKKGVSMEEFTLTAATVIEYYLKVTVRSFGDILREGRLLMVFFECRDLWML